MTDRGRSLAVTASRGTRWRRLGATLLLLVAAASAATADRAAADFFVQRAEKALKDRKWSDAQDLFRKALEEDERHVPARAGLGEALLATGNRSSALDAWRRALSDADATKPLPAPWSAIATRVRKRLADAEAASAALAQIVDRHVDRLMALAERSLEAEPDVTAGALREALRLRPGHPKAAEFFERIGSPPGDWIPLFDGRTLAGWSVQEHSPYFRVVDGELIGALDKGMITILSERSFKGDFDLRLEAHFLERHEGLPGLSLGGAVKSQWQGTFLGVFGQEVNVREWDGPEKSAQSFSFGKPIADLETPFDPEEWHAYELRFRGKEVHVLIDGETIATIQRLAGREEGVVALVVQSAKVAMRKVEAMQR